MPCIRCSKEVFPRPSALARGALDQMPLANRLLDHTHRRPSTGRLAEIRRPLLKLTGRSDRFSSARSFAADQDFPLT